MKITNRYRGDTGAEFKQDKETFCPNCGVQDVYIEMSEGDYYTGPDYFCISCKAEFNLPTGVTVRSSAKIEN